jgi:uncharacterized protein (DUF952 family)
VAGAVEPVFHVALRRDWDAARHGGEYRVSTLGRTLDQEGFVHASFRHQWPHIRGAFYGHVDEPLVLLEIDPARLDAALVVETPPGAAEAFPHIYGPVPVTAVVAVTELS